MSAAKNNVVEVVGCKILSVGLPARDREKVVKVYVTVIQNGSSQLVHPTSGQRLFEVDHSFTYVWAHFNEKIHNIPKECKLILELRLLDHQTEKEIKFASCVISSSALSEDILYYDLTDVEARRADGVLASVGLRLIPASKLQQIRLVPERWTAIGRLRAIIWRGRKILSTYPVYLTIGLAVAGLDKHKSSVVNIPRDPIFDHIADLDLSTMQGDLIIALWEVHSVRSHKQLGQIIIPLSWLANMSARSVSGTTASISGWFQFLPVNRPTAYNNGGQYRPYIPGTPSFTGFGLDEPEKDKCVGYLRVQLSISLKKPILRSLFFQPSLYAHETAHVEVLDDDSIMTIVASMIVAKNNLMQIIHKLRYPMWLSTFLDIVRWREHPLFTFIAIYFWTYLILVAPTWQYPIIGCLFFIFIGFATSRRRNFSSSHLYIPDMDVDTSEESSLREKYQKLKSAAYTVASLVETTRVSIERLGNIFTWADPMLTLATIVLLLSFCVTFSLLLIIFPPHAFIFCSGMMTFVPEDFMDFAIARFKEYKRNVKKYIKHRRHNAALMKEAVDKEAAAAAEKLVRTADVVSSGVVTGTNSIFPVDVPAEGIDIRHTESAPSLGKAGSKPNIFIHGGSTQRRRASVTFGHISTTAPSTSVSLCPPDLSPAGHVCSAFLMSQYWGKGVNGKSSLMDGTPRSPTNDKVTSSFGSESEIKIPYIATDGAGNSSVGHSLGKHWSSRWCEVWKAPPALSVTGKVEGQQIFINLENAVAHYIGGILISKSRDYSNRQLSEDTDGTASAVGEGDSPRKELFGFRRTIKAAINRRKSVMNAEPFLSAAALSFDGRASDIQQRESIASSAGKAVSSAKDNLYKEIFCFSVYQQSKGKNTGEFEMIFACNSQADAQAWVSSINSVSTVNITTAANIIASAETSVSSGFNKSTMPGNSGKQNEIDYGSDDDEVTSESMRRKVQAYIMNWLSLAPDDMELAHRYFCRTLQYSGTLEHSINKGFQAPFSNSPSIFPVPEDVSSSGPADFTSFASYEPGQPYIAVTILSARNLPPASDIISSFDIISGLHYMYCDLWVSPIRSPKLRSSKQPSKENPVFRDNLTFSLCQPDQEVDTGNAVKTSLPVLQGPVSDAEVLAAANKISLHCNVYNHKPISFGDDELLGTATISIKNLGFTAAPSESVYDWFPLLDSKGEELLNSAAVRLKVQLLI